MGDLIWPTRPILSLIKHFYYDTHVDTRKELHSLEGEPTVIETDPALTPAVWHGSEQEIFSDTEVNNTLKIQIRFKAIDCYGYQAIFIILIDRFRSGSWHRELRDKVCITTPRYEHDTWYYCDREYALNQTISFFPREDTELEDTELKFKITAFTIVGERGHLSEPRSREFSAILKPPKRIIVREYLEGVRERSEFHYEKLLKLYGN